MHATTSAPLENNQTVHGSLGFRKKLIWRKALVICGHADLLIPVSVRWFPILCSHISSILTVLQSPVPVMAALLIMEITYIPVLHAISNHVDKTVAESLLCALSISTVQLPENVAENCSDLDLFAKLSVILWCFIHSTNPGMICHLQFWYSCHFRDIFFSVNHDLQNSAWFSTEIV